MSIFAWLVAGVIVEWVDKIVPLLAKRLRSLHL
jgi:hypothetical protein